MFVSFKKLQALQRSYICFLQVDDISVALEAECDIPSNPGRFSPDILDAMDRLVPSALGSVPTGNKVNNVKFTLLVMKYNKLGFCFF